MNSVSYVRVVVCDSIVMSSRVDSNYEDSFHLELVRCHHHHRHPSWVCLRYVRSSQIPRLPARSRSSCRWRPSIGPSNARLPLTREQDACVESFHRIGPARRGRAAPRPRRAPPPGPPPQALPRALPPCPRGTTARLAQNLGAHDRARAARGRPPVGAACRRRHSPHS